MTKPIPLQDVRSLLAEIDHIQESLQASIDALNRGDERLADAILVDADKTLESIQARVELHKLQQSGGRVS